MRVSEFFSRPSFGVGFACVVYIPAGSACMIMHEAQPHGIYETEAQPQLNGGLKIVKG